VQEQSTIRFRQPHRSEPHWQSQQTKWWHSVQPPHAEQPLPQLLHTFLLHQQPVL
jgi:hypothetical protein